MKLLRKDFAPNQRITTFFVLEQIELRISKNMNQFLLLHLYDKTGGIKGYIWGNLVEALTALKDKTFVKVRGITKSINASLILEIEKIREAKIEEIDIRDFLDMVPGGIDLWHEKLLDSVKLIQETNCLKLINAFLEDSRFLEIFTTAPAGTIVHHNYIGGLLEHTVNTMSLAATMSDRYPAIIDRDLILTGAFLHDIGKTKEISSGIFKEYTTEGKLLGHIASGLLLLEEKLSQFINFPYNLSLLLKHMILSHHGAIEYGSPVRPATPEAVALHLVDSADARANHLYCHLGNSNPNTTWSHFDRFLNTEIYQEKFDRFNLENRKERIA